MGLAGMAFIAADELLPWRRPVTYGTAVHPGPGSRQADRCAQRDLGLTDAGHWPQDVDANRCGLVGRPGSAQASAFEKSYDEGTSLGKEPITLATCVWSASATFGIPVVRFAVDEDRRRKLPPPKAEFGTKPA
jgi:hypothetical protein